MKKIFGILFIALAIFATSCKKKCLDPSADLVANFDLPIEPYTDNELTFNNTSIGAVSYEWDFGDGTPKSHSLHPKHTYETDGWYSVKLTASDGNISATSEKGFYVSSEVD